MSIRCAVALQIKKNQFKATSPYNDGYPNVIIDLLSKNYMDRKKIEQLTTYLYGADLEDDLKDIPEDLKNNDILKSIDDVEHYARRYGFIYLYTLNNEWVFKPTGAEMDWIRFSDYKPVKV